MEFIKSFIDFLIEHKSSKATVKNYRADISQFVKWYEATYKTTFSPNDVTNQIIASYKTVRLSSDSNNTLSQKTIERHLSSLRKFFSYLLSENITTSNPFAASEEKQIEKDIWHIQAFKNFLYVNNSSNLTIKNYIIDVRQFLKWVEEVVQAQEAWIVTDQNIFTYINKNLIEEYRSRLIESSGFSPTSVNRKLSSLRKYISWAVDNGIVANIEEDPISNNLVKDDVLKNISENINDNKYITNKHFDEVIANQTSAYSSIPPIRLIQRAFKLLDLAFVFFLIIPTAKAFKLSKYNFWKFKGKEVFTSQTPISPKLDSINKLNRIQNNVSNRLLNLRKQNPNIKKIFYAPLSVSTKYMPFHKKLLFHLRYTRPKWYKKYHSYSITHYFHFAILIIFASTVAFITYQHFFQSKGNQAEAVAQTTIPRILSFQGILTDANGNPIATTKQIRFELYNDPSATGSGKELWEEVRTVTPDQNGIFAVNLGINGVSTGNCASFPPPGPATGACTIPVSVFTQNSNVYLGVTIGSDIELTPRQQIAAVGFAANSESLQGLIPTTDTGSISSLSLGNYYEVLATDGNGNVTLGGSTLTTIQETGGGLRLIGNPLILTTANGGNLQLSTDTKGLIDVQKPLTNTTTNGNARINGTGNVTDTGAVEVDGLFATLATSSGQSAVTIDQQSTGPVLSASVSGQAVFTIDNSGNLTNSGNITTSGSGAGLTFSGGSTHNISASGGTLQLGAITLNGAIAGGGQNITGLGTINGLGITANTGVITTGTWNANPISTQYGGTGQNWSSAAQGSIPYFSSTGGMGLIGVGSSAQCLIGGTTPTWSSCSSASSNYWQLDATGKVLSQINSYDLTVGSSPATGSSTSSAAFQVFALSKGNTPAGTISSAGNLQVAGIASSSALAVGYGINQVTANNLVVSGNVGIGTNTPAALLDIEGTTGAPNANQVLKIIGGTGVGGGSGLAGGTGAIASISAGNGGAGGSNASGNGGFGGNGGGQLILAGSGGTGGNSTLANQSGGFGGQGGTLGFVTGNGGNGGSDTAGSGAATSNGGNGGNGGDFNLILGTGGQGGSSHGSSSTIGLGGNGGSVYLQAGTGGTAGAAGNGINNDGLGGNITIAGGTGGSSTLGTFGNGGKVYIYGGLAGSGSVGNVVLAQTSAGVNQGNVGIGQANPTSILDIGTVNPTIQADSSNTNLALSTNGTGSLFIDTTAAGNIKIASNAALLSLGNSTHLTTLLGNNIYNPNITGAGNTGGVFYDANNQGSLAVTAAGSNGNCLLSGGAGAPTWGSCGSAGGSYWQLNSNVVSPVQNYFDLSVGGTATASAPFQVFASRNPLTFTPAGTISTLGNIQVAGVASSSALAVGYGQNQVQSGSGNAVFSGNVGVGTNTTSNAQLTDQLSSYTLLNSLQVYYKFDENSGTIANDATGNGNTATLNGANIWTSSGKINSGLQLDGSTNYVSTNYVGPLGSNARSVNIWFKGWTTTERTIWNYGGAGTAGALDFEEGIGGNGNSIGFRTGGGAYGYWTTSLTNDGLWHMLTVTYAAGGLENTIKLYLDGVQQNSLTDNFGGNTVNTTSGVLTMGDITGTGISGLDEFAVWGRSLTSAEVTQLYNSGSGKQYSFTSLLQLLSNSGSVLSSFNGAGSLGIGTIAQNALDVFGSAAFGSYAGNQYAPTNGLIISGNVGIGTSSPSGQLQVFGSSNNPTASISANSAYTGLLVDNSGGTSAQGSIFTASTSGITKFTVNNNGLILVGTNSTTNPGTLSVYGTIQSNGIANGGTDFLALGLPSTPTGLPQYLGNWQSTQAWALGPISNSSTDKTVYLGIASNTTGTWNGASYANLSVGGNVAVGYHYPSFTGIASLIVNQQTGGADLITASASGTTKFNVDNNGDITIAAGSYIDTNAGGTLSIGTNNATTLNLATNTNVTALSIGNGSSVDKIFGSGITTNQNSVLYLGAANQLGAATTGSSNLCLVSGANTPTWTACSGVSSNYWIQTNGIGVANGGYTALGNTTTDLLIGGTSTASAEFAVLNVAPGLTPVASVSAGSSGTGTTENSGISLSANGTIQTVGRTTLTVGGNTTGDIFFNPGGVGLGNSLSIDVGGNVGIGMNNGNVPNAPLQIRTAIPDVSNGTDINITGTMSSLTNGQYGARITPQLGISSNPASNLFEYGAENSPSFNMANTGVTFSKVFLVGSDANNFLSGNGILGTSIGFQTETTLNNDTTRVTNAIGLNVEGIVKNCLTCVVGNSTGIDIFDQSGLATNTANLVINTSGTVPTGNYSIYNASSLQNYFAGNLGLGTVSPTAQLQVVGTNSPTASISANSAFTGLVVDNKGGTANLGDIFTASASGLARFTIANNGNLTLNGSTYTTNNNSVLYTNGSGNLLAATTGSSNLCLVSGVSAPTWTACSGVSSNYWIQTNGIGVAGGGYTALGNTTTDLLIGGTSTASAKFAVLNVAPGGTPVASVSAGTSSSGTTENSGIALSANGSIQSVGKTTLTIGGNTTGDISLNPGNNGAGTLYLASTGNIGIGTTAPTAQLQVGGGLSSPGNITVSSISANTNQAGLIVDNGGGLNNAGAIFTASAAGMSRFTIANSGNLTLNASTYTANNINVLYSNSSGNVLAASTSTGNLCLTSNSGGTAAAWGNCSSASSNYWQLSGNVLSPGLLSDDLVIGGSSTSSAAFQVFSGKKTYGAITEPAGTASSSGDLSFGAANGTTQNLNILNGNSFQIRTSPGGPEGLLATPALYVKNNGNVGIGTVAPASKLEVNGDISSKNTSVQGYVYAYDTSGSHYVRMYNDGTNGYVSLSDGATLGISSNTYVFTQTQQYFRAQGNTFTNYVGLQDTDATGGKLTTSFANLNINTDMTTVVNTTGTNVSDIFAASSSATTRFVINSNGNVGIGTSQPGAQLQIVGTNAPTASISANSAYAGLVIDNKGGTNNGGDLFTASSAGQTRFRIANTGAALFQGDTLTSIGNGAQYNGSNAVINAIGDSGSLIPNSGFESALAGTSSASTVYFADGWAIAATMSANTIPQTTRDTSTSAKGQASAKINFNGGLAEQTAIYSDCVPLALASGTGSYNLYYYAKYSSNIPTVRSYIDGYTSKANCQGDISPTIGGMGSPTLTTSWANYGTANISGLGANITWGRVHFFIASTNPGGAAWIDGVRLIESDTSHGVDYAENYPANPSNIPQPGDVVTILPLNGVTVVQPSTTYQDSSTIGVVSTQPGEVLDDGQMPSPKVPIALSGRIPVKVSTKYGSIHVGDYVTSSEIPGVAVKSTRPGIVIGTAMEDDTDPNPDDINSIVVFTHVGYENPMPQIASINDLSITANDNSVDNSLAYIIKDATGNTIDYIDAFSSAAIGVLKAGSIQATDIATNTLSINGQSIKDYILSVVQNAGLNNGTLISPIASVNEIHTNLISPLSENGNVEIALGNNTVSVQNKTTGKTVASIDDNGNATFSGTIRAKRIIADEIVGLNNSTESASYITQNVSNITNVYNSTPSASSNIISPVSSGSGQIASNVDTLSSSNLQTSNIDIASYSSELQSVNNLQETTGSFTDGLIAFGPSSFTDVSVAGKFSVDRSLTIGSNSINVIGNDLQLQPLQQGGVSIEGGLVYIDASGNMRVNGNTEFAQNVTVKGTLAAGIISPLANQNLNVELPGNNNFNVQTATGSSVLQINGKGDINSSGSGNFADVLANEFNIIRSAQADTSNTQTVASGSAGTATIVKGQTERTIITPYVKANSLIYITPTSDTQGVIPYVARQTTNDPDNNNKSSFTIQISTPTSKNINVNWWIVN